MAESNIRETLKASTFELKEKQEFFKKKWRREHISTIIACTVAWIVLMAALIIQNVEVYLCGTIGSLLAIIYYRVLNNRMLAYVEDHIYGGKCSVALSLTIKDRLQKCRRSLFVFRNI